MNNNLEDILTEFFNHSNNYKLLNLAAVGLFIELCYRYLAKSPRYGALYVGNNTDAIPIFYPVEIARLLGRQLSDIEPLLNELYSHKILLNQKDEFDREYLYFEPMMKIYYRRLQCQNAGKNRWKYKKLLSKKSKNNQPDLFPEIDAERLESIKTLCREFSAVILANHPKAYKVKLPTQEPEPNWIKTFDAILSIDHRTETEIRQVFEIIKRDHIPRGNNKFCWANVFSSTSSIKSLRPKFDQILKLEHQQNHKHPKLGNDTKNIDLPYLNNPKEMN